MCISCVLLNLFCFWSSLPGCHCVQLCRVGIAAFVSSLLRLSSAYSTGAGTPSVTRQQWKWEECTIAFRHWCNVISVIICRHWSDPNQKSAEVCNSFLLNNMRCNTRFRGGGLIWGHCFLACYLFRLNLLSQQIIVCTVSLCLIG